MAPPVFSLRCTCLDDFVFLLNERDVCKKLLKFYWLLYNKDKLVVAALEAVEFELISVETIQLAFYYFLFD
jgi:hypothetical protein